MENDLDDFFAKKDKSKKKTKSKYTVDDLLQAKKDNEEKSAKLKSKKKSKDHSHGEGVSGIKTEGDDEEWVEIEEEAEKDYTGLRIQNLQITNKGDDDRQDNSSQREDGEDGESREAAQGPWKMQASSVPVPAVSNAVNSVCETTANESVKETSKSSGRYVPPQLRKTLGDTPAVSVSSTPSKFNSRGKKAAPNVNSQEDFPTLGSVAEPNEGGAFEKIRGGARQTDDPNSRQMKLAVGNKFDALHADDG